MGPHYGTSSDGSAIGLTRLPALADAMIATPAVKLQLFANRRWEVGGLGRLDEVPPPAAKKGRWFMLNMNILIIFFILMLTALHSYYLNVNG